MGDLRSVRARAGSPAARALRACGTCAVVLCLLAVAARTAAAAPVVRYQVDQRGDFVLLGNTVAWDCGSGAAAPLVGTIGACGSNRSDSAADVFWRADDATGSAAANTGIAAADARSTAVLALPDGAAITYARLYWSASPADGASPDAAVLLERPGGTLAETVRADASATVTSDASGVRFFYQSTADVTAPVRAAGAGAFRVSGIDSVELANLNHENPYVAWWLVVFYRREAEPVRNLTLFDGLDIVNTNGPDVAVTLSGFLVPNAGFDAKLGAIAFEGDNSITGDALSFGGRTLSDAQNPANNFFNGTRSLLGAAVSTAGDLPRLSGARGTLAGVDLDVVDVTPYLTRGQSSVQIVASTSSDRYLLGGFVTSIATFKPDFVSAAKTARNLTDRPAGKVSPGDVIEYTLTATNTGNDTATNVVLTDVLPPAVTFVPGSLRIASGANAGAKTDAADGDQAEYLASIRTVRVRLGAGADGVSGGTIPIGGAFSVVFRVTVNAGARGAVDNIGSINAAGQAGDPASSYPTNGGAPSRFVVDECTADSECAAGLRCLTELTPSVCGNCASSAQCSGDRPTCDASTHVCRPCAAASDCPGSAPVCDGASGRCVECLLSRDCPSQLPVCHTAARACVACLTDGDCGAALPVCDVTSRTCRGCARDAECPAQAPACQPSGACGQCSATLATSCAGATPVCDANAGRCVGCVAHTECPGTAPVCDPTAQVCRGCAGDVECPAQAPACQPSGACGQCSPSNASRCGGATPVCDGTAGVCVGCRGDADCGGTTPTCAPETRTCAPCTPGGCPGSAPVCTSTGACAQCTPAAADACAGATPVCDGATWTCRPCASNAECPASAPVCRPDGACGQCAAGIPGVCGGATPVCDAARGVCVGCVSDADCAGTSPHCAAETQRCVPCRPDAPSTCPDPARPACQTSGALAGACTECAPGDTRLCGGVKPVCVVGVGLCGCSGSDGDAACGDAASGRVCSGTVGACVPGCASGPGRNGCPAGQTCTASDADVGTCVAGCASDAECGAGLPRCDLTAPTPTCVECTSNADCAAPLVCHGVTRTCVECTAATVAACAETAAGSTCLPNGTCGCRVDDDCGEAGGGRVCDGAIGKCVIGCRPAAAHGCPAGWTCAPTSNELGACIPPSGSGGASGADGGAGATGADGGGGSAGTGGTSGAGGAADGAADDAAEAPRDGAGGDARVDGVISHDDGGDPRADGSVPHGDGDDANGEGSGAVLRGTALLAGGGCACSAAPDARGWSTAPLLAPFVLLVLRRRRRR